MPKFGFVIDQRKCIGCHACTVACKSENDVPVGDFRTWVKYTEKGTFPTVKRHFTVLRCNHCDDAPCVEICPVVALHKRPDAIVDLDHDLCIGCRACMQACPYDALYLNEDTGTAEKCHYCAHRTELGLEPACVVVCPEQAIVAGDVEDPQSNIATLIREEPTSQRRLEKETKPRVWYVDALPESIEPGKAAEPSTYLWSERPDAPPPDADVHKPENVTTTLDVGHPPVWGYHIWAYLVTKNIAAGAGMIAPFLLWLGVSAGGARDFAPEIIALVFLGITSFFLVHDLGRPSRALKIIFHPNTKSWLVKGTWILMAFGGLSTLIIALRFLDAHRAANILRWVNFPPALMASGYSAWLFAQCKGRDLWTEKGTFWQLVSRAAFMGAGIGALLPVDPDARMTCLRLFVGLGVVCGVLMYWERGHDSGTEHARRARAILRRSPRDQAGIVLVVLAAIVAQLGDFFFTDGSGGETAAVTLALVAATVGLLLHERSWIRAGQAVPIS